MGTILQDIKHYKTEMEKMHSRGMELTNRDVPIYGVAEIIDRLERIESKLEDKHEKPPVGLKPEWLHSEERRIEISAAITRYMEAGKEIPIEWIDEYNVLVFRKAYREASSKKE